MKRDLILLLGVSCALAVALSCSRTDRKKSVDYVDPFICTLGDHGHLFPGAVVPFGMVKLGPDTYPSSLTGSGDWAHSGYNYADTLIRGFSHIRKESSGGTQVYDRGWIASVLPAVGLPEIDRSKTAVAIAKRRERATAGLYQVTLVDEGIEVALTASTHCGFHRYRFPKSEDAHVLFDPGSRAFVQRSCITVAGDNAFSGTLRTHSSAIHFWACFDKPFISFATWDTVLHRGVRHFEAQRAGVLFDFHTLAEEPLLFKIGFSVISEEQARLNLQSEIPHWNFAAAAKAARESWSNILDRVEVDGDEEYKKSFYTALYHSCQQPSNITDVNGKYLGFDQQVHRSEGFLFHDNYAFWDDYRTKFPLMSLVDPATFKNVVHSIQHLYRHCADYWTYSNPKHEPHVGGFSVSGKDGFRPFLTCRHEHMLTVALDAYEKGIAREDIESMYQGMRSETMTQMPKEYDRLGYIPARPDQTFEYSYDSWCVAQMAAKAGHAEEHDYFMRRAGYYRNTWDSRIGFLRARAADGTWLDFPDDPAVNREKYMYEGSPWQWRWFVPHDVPGMIEMMGGNERFIRELDYFFTNHLYQAGNQPDIHAPFLFNMAGAPWLTQKWVRTLLTEPMTHRYGTHEFYQTPIFDRIYKAAPDGYLPEMDDDYGCMAAWYVLSAMGLFPVGPGSPVYQLTAPVFDRVSIRLDKDFYPGQQFTIRANRLSAKNIYIQSATLNGRAYNRSSINHETIIHGGELIFEMGPQPNKQWGL